MFPPRQSSASPSDDGRLLQTSCSRAYNPVRPPPFWEFVNGSRDPLFRGVSSSNLSINNLLCGLEDLYFPLKCGFFRCYNLFHLSFGRILGNKSIGRTFVEVFVSHESQVYSDLLHFYRLIEAVGCFTSFADLYGGAGGNLRSHDQRCSLLPILCVLSCYRFSSPFSLSYINTKFPSVAMLLTLL